MSPAVKYSSTKPPIAVLCATQHHQQVLVRPSIVRVVAMRRRRRVVACARYSCPGSGPLPAREALIRARSCARRGPHRGWTATFDEVSDRHARESFRRLLATPEWERGRSRQSSRNRSAPPAFSSRRPSAVQWPLRALPLTKAQGGA